MEAWRLSDGQVKPKVGTLHGALDRLTGEGLLAPDRDEVEGGWLRRYYRLADLGAAELGGQAARLAVVALQAGERLKARGLVPPATVPGPAARRGIAAAGGAA